MNFEIHKPGLERMVQEEILSGHRGDLLTEALLAWRVKNAALGYISGWVPKCGVLSGASVSPVVGLGY